MAVDFLSDDNLDMVIQNGDFAVGESEVTEAKVILLSVPGSFLHHPFVGVNIRQWVGAPISPKERANMMREIKVQMAADGKQNIKFSGTGDNFSLLL
ncbi:MAG: hypothetical protein MH137_11115 [Flavobacteriales bacterium]|nr:hypothetical protein [Flavobacteriales bacterium]